MFITFEGADGSGKTTAFNLLEQYFKEKKIRFIATREPGGVNSWEAAAIRSIILNPSSTIDPMTETILYAADRRLNLERNIWPALKEGKIVICDRYLDSSVAYQGHARNLGVKKIRDLQDVITEKTYPDLTLYFDLPLKVAQKRTKSRGNKDKLEMLSNNFRKKVYEGYQLQIVKYPKRFVIIDASKDRQKVFDEVKSIVNAFLIDKA